MAPHAWPVQWCKMLPGLLLQSYCNTWERSRVAQYSHTYSFYLQMVQHVILWSITLTDTRLFFLARCWYTENEYKPSLDVTWHASSDWFGTLGMLTAVWWGLEILLSMSGRGENVKNVVCCCCCCGFLGLGGQKSWTPAFQHPLHHVCPTKYSTN